MSRRAPDGETSRLEYRAYSRSDETRRACEKNRVQTDRIHSPGSLADHPTKGCTVWDPYRSHYQQSCQGQSIRFATILLSNLSRLRPARPSFRGIRGDSVPRFFLCPAVPRRGIQRVVAPLTAFIGSRSRNVLGRSLRVRATCSAPEPSSTQLAPAGERDDLPVLKMNSPKHGKVSCGGPRAKQERPRGRSPRRSSGSAKAECASWWYIQRAHARRGQA